MKLGVFGGTFDPIHLGHLRVAEEACAALGLDRLLFIPAKVPPHKKRDDLSDARTRLALVRAGVRGNPRFRVSDMELRREGPSYTVDTLRLLREGRQRPERLWFLLGCDAFREIDTWHRYEEIFALADLAVLRRPPDDALPPPPRGMTGEFEPIEGGYRHRSGHEVRFLRVSALDISASEVRRALKEGRSIRYWVPEPVRRALERARDAGSRSGPCQRGTPC